MIKIVVCVLLAAVLVSSGGPKNKGHSAEKFFKPPPPAPPKKGHSNEVFSFTCPQVNATENYTFDKLVGSWYITASLNSFVSDETSCQNVNFTLASASVLNITVSPGKPCKNKYKDAYTGFVIGNGRFNLTLKDRFVSFNTTFTVLSANDQHTLLYNCGTSRKKTLKVVLLSKNSTFDAAAFNQSTLLLQTYAVPVKNFRNTKCTL